MDSRIDLERLEGLLERATKGRWIIHSEKTFAFPPVIHAVENGFHQPLEPYFPEADQELIVAMHEALPTLLAERKFLLARIEAAEKALNEIANAVRLGATTDLAAWANLAEACQSHARAAAQWQAGREGEG